MEAREHRFSSAEPVHAVRSASVDGVDPLVERSHFSKNGDKRSGCRREKFVGGLGDFKFERFGFRFPSGLCFAFDGGLVVRCQCFDGIAQTLDRVFGIVRFAPRCRIEDARIERPSLGLLTGDLGGGDGGAALGEDAGENF
jgi:hypothetical protein